MKYALSIMVALVVLYGLNAKAGDVKYCQDLETGDIITVPENMPCPYPTAEM